MPIFSGQDARKFIIDLIDDLFVYSAISSFSESDVLRRVLPVAYDNRIRRELDARTQYAEEGLRDYIRTTQKLFRWADPTTPETVEVPPVVRQCHLHFQRHLLGHSSLLSRSLPALLGKLRRPPFGSTTTSHNLQTVLLGPLVSHHLPRRRNYARVTLRTSMVRASSRVPMCFVGDV